MKELLIVTSFSRWKSKRREVCDFSRATEDGRDLSTNSLISEAVLWTIKQYQQSVKHMDHQLLAKVNMKEKFKVS